MWALVENGIVVQVFPYPMPFVLNGVQYPGDWFFSTSTEEKAALGILPIVRDLIPAGYHAVASTYEVLPDQVLEHFTTEANPPPSSDALKDYTKQKELLVEEGGVLFAGVEVPTTRDAQGVISRAAAYGAAPDPVTRKFHLVNRAGNYSTLTLAQATDLARAVEEHVLAAIDAAATIFAEIDAGVITTYAEIDESPLWPPVLPPPVQP